MTTDTTTSEPTAKTVKAIDTLRPTFTAFVKAYGSLAMSREKLAPKFASTFASWKEETGGTLAGFCREFDPSVPEDREGYKQHRTYGAADYLMRLAARQERESLSPQARAKRLQNRPVTGHKALARTLASVLPLIDPEAVDKVWHSLAASLKWTDTMIDNLKASVAEEQPAFNLRAPKGSHVTKTLQVVERAAA